MVWAPRMVQVITNRKNLAPFHRRPKFSVCKLQNIQWTQQNVCSHKFTDWPNIWLPMLKMFNILLQWTVTCVYPKLHYNRSISSALKVIGHASFKANVPGWSLQHQEACSLYPVAIFGNISWHSLNMFHNWNTTFKRTFICVRSWINGGYSAMASYRSEQDHLSTDLIHFKSTHLMSTHDFNFKNSA